MIQTYGRKEAFRTMFGNKTPNIGRVLTQTFAQMISEKCHHIDYFYDGFWHVFSGDREWVTPDDLNLMLSGKMKLDQNAGPNALRIETAYRFFFGDVSLWFENEMHQITKTSNSNDIPHGFKNDQTVLFLGHAGRFNWDEERSIC